MNTHVELKTKITIGLAIAVVVVLTLLVPSPLHDWFVSSTIGGVPVRMGAFALLILFTPPAILSSILRSFDVDYEDEAPKDVAMHAPM